jgi:hypothetical protein
VAGGAGDAAWDGAALVGWAVAPFGAGVVAGAAFVGAAFAGAVPLIGAVAAVVCDEFPGVGLAAGAGVAGALASEDGGFAASDEPFAGAVPVAPWSPG